MQLRSKRLRCYQGPSLCAENWNNKHWSHFGNLQVFTMLLGKQLQCLTTFTGKILFPHALRAFSLLPLVTVSLFVLCLALGRRFGFPPLCSSPLPSPPLLASQPSPAQPSHFPPPWSSLLWGLADCFSGEAITPQPLSSGEEVMRTSDRPLPRGRQGRSFLAFETYSSNSLLSIFLTLFSSRV